MIHVVGIGLDGAKGLTEPVRKIVEQATILVGSDRHLGYFPDHGAERLAIGSINMILRKIRRRLETALVQDTSEGAKQPDPLLQGDRVSVPFIVILVSGDPLFFGLGRLLLESFPPEQLTFHPHVSSIQLAFNRVKIPWQDAWVISAHGRSCDELIDALKKGVEKIAVLTDERNTPGTIARLILSLELATKYKFWVAENLGSPEEKVASWSDLTAVDQQKFAPLNVVVLVRQSPEKTQPLDLQQLPQLGIPDRYFFTFSDRPGLMTKREVRMLILGELGLQPNQTIWDIGAGTGSVSIEIARLFPTSDVYAIEKSAAGIALIEQNCHRFHVSNVVSIYGSAPSILYRLAVPHRIFIGGSGGSLRQILSLCSSYMAPGGVIVLAIATLENLTIALNWVQHSGWHSRVLQVNLSRSVPVAELTRFSPLNPIAIVTLTQK